MVDQAPTPAANKSPRERLEELFPSCETDCTDGCKYGCLGWVHRFPALETATDESVPKDRKD